MHTTDHTSPRKVFRSLQGGAAYDEPTTETTTYSLVFNEALYYGIKLDHSLINPNQV
jgi:hypothetical protein